MNVENREWDILRAIKAGKKPEDIKPPLKDGYEKEFYETHKKEYEDFKKRGINICWSPVTD